MSRYTDFLLFNNEINYVKENREAYEKILNGKSLKNKNISNICKKIFCDYLKNNNFNTEDFNISEIKNTKDYIEIIANVNTKLLLSLYTIFDDKSISQNFSYRYYKPNTRESYNSIKETILKYFKNNDEKNIDNIFDKSDRGTFPLVFYKINSNFKIFNDLNNTLSLNTIFNQNKEYRLSFYEKEFLNIYGIGIKLKTLFSKNFKNIHLRIYKNSFIGCTRESFILNLDEKNENCAYEKINKFLNNISFFKDNWIYICLYFFLKQAEIIYLFKDINERYSLTIDRLTSFTNNAYYKDNILIEETDIANLYEICNILLILIIKLILVNENVYMYSSSYISNKKFLKDITDKILEKGLINEINNHLLSEEEVKELLLKLM